MNSSNSHQCVVCGQQGTTMLYGGKCSGWSKSHIVDRIVDPSENTPWDKANPETPTVRQLYKLVSYMDTRLIEVERELERYKNNLAENKEQL